MKGYDFLNKKNFSVTLSLVLVRIVFVLSLIHILSVAVIGRHFIDYAYLRPNAQTQPVA